MTEQRGRAPAASQPRILLRRLRRSPSVVVGLGLTFVVVAIAVLDTRLAPGVAFTTSAAHRLEPPSWSHLMGTDQLGRDLFTGVVQGAHTSMSIVLGVVVISTVVGLLAGTAGGLRGGVVDDAVLRLVEIVQSVPRFFLAILLVGWFGAGTHLLTLLLGFTSWPFLARIVRAEALSLREREFVAAARSSGASDVRVAVTHIVPNALPVTLVVVALTASRVVLLEAGLAFLGLSDPNIPSWGALINNAQPYLARAWWMSVFPGLAILVAVFGMNLLADGLSDLFDREGFLDGALHPERDIVEVV